MCDYAPSTLPITAYRVPGGDRSGAPPFGAPTAQRELKVSFRIFGVMKISNSVFSSDSEVVLNR